MQKPLSALVCAVGVLLGSGEALAQDSPLPPLMRIVVPAAPGSATDAMARVVAHEMAGRTGSNVIVENRPGASTMLGSAAVAKGAKDGSMLLINSTTLVSTAATMPTPPLHVINDLVPVAMLGQNPLVITVSAKSNIKTPAELIAAAKANPGALTHGTAGVGSIAHVAQELLSENAKITMNHVPYRGASLAVTDMATGVIDMVIAARSTVEPGIKSGRARAIAVTSLQRNPAFPDLPPMASASPGFALDLWLGIFAPKGTPAPLVARLNRELNAIAGSARVREIMAFDGGVATPMAPEQFAMRVRNDFSAFKKLAAEKHLVAE